MLRGCSLRRATSPGGPDGGPLHRGVPAWPYPNVRRACRTGQTRRAAGRGSPSHARMRDLSSLDTPPRAHPGRVAAGAAAERGDWFPEDRSMDALDPLFAGPWGPVLIFCLRIVDVSLATLRVLLAVRNHRL